MDDKEKFQCNGDCLNCQASPNRKVQWQYCTAQHTYNTMRMIEALQMSVLTMQGTINELSEKIKEMAAKIEAIQNSEAVAIDTAAHSERPLFPSADDDDDITQSGDGVI